jgi:hypothetical protein
MEAENTHKKLTDLNGQITRSYNDSNLKYAIQLCDEFEKLLNELGDDDGSISLQEHWALLHTVRSNNELAIDRMVRVLSYLEKLKVTGYPVEPEWVCRRLTELALLYAKVGDITNSEAILQLAQAKAES